MASSVPLTPKGARISRVARTPKSIKKKTILTNDFDQSYIEEDDETYVYNGSASDDDDEDDEDDGGDEMDELKEEQELWKSEGADDNDDDDDDDDDNSTEVESQVSDEKKTSVADQRPKSNSKIIDLEPQQDISEFRRFLIKHEVVRKALHSSFGFVTLYLYSIGVTTGGLVPPFIGLFLILFTNDYIRFQNPEFNKKMVERFYYIVREREVDHYNGTLYYLGGLITVFSFLPKDISMMSVILLSWADTAASTFGRKYGKYTFQIAKGKSFAGALASFITGILSCYILYGYFIAKYTNKVDKVDQIFWQSSQSTLSIHVYAFVCGLVASFSECVNIYGLDDNFTIPVLSGFLLYGLVRYFHT